MLVGRQAALELLRERIAAGRAVCLHGELGIGKTTLIRSALEAADRRVFAGGGLASLTWSAYLPLLRAIRVPLPAGDRAVIATYVAHRVRDGVLVIDDLQYADRETLALLPSVAPRVALVLALRNGEAGSAAALATAQACGCELIGLEAMDEASAAQLVRLRNSRLSQLEVQALVASAGGNPLLLEELARGEEAESTVRGAVSRRLARCSDPAREALALLGLLGRPAPPEVLGAAAQELAGAGLIDGQGGQVSLRHPVFGERAIDGLDGAVRRRLHLRLARGMADPGERARHLAAAGHRAEAGQAASEAAERALSDGERARHLGLAAECASGADADRLRLQAAIVLIDAGEPASVVRVLQRIQAGDGRVAAEAALLSARAQNALGDCAAAAAAASTGLGLAPGDRSLSLPLQIERLRARTVDAGTDLGVLLAEARELAGLCELGSVAEARAAAALGAIELAAGQAEWAATLERAVELARLSDEFDVECGAAGTLVAGHLLGGAGAEARGWAVELEQRCAVRLLGAQRLEFTARRLWLDLHERGACMEVIDACRALLRDPAPDPAAGQLEGLLALALADTNQLPEARRVLERALERPTSDRGRLLSWTLAEIELLSGEAARAVTLARACLADRLAAHPVGALAAVTEAWATRNQTEAGGAPPAAAVGRRSFGGSEAELSGIAALLDQPAAAQTYFDSGASAWLGVQRRGELRCRWAAAESARRAGETAPALEQLRAVADAVQASGFTVLLARVRRSLRDAGVRDASGRSADPRGLTAREREILELVGQGLTTGAIARQLSLEPATVETHIESAREKLGATNRTQAAILARG